MQILQRLRHKVLETSSILESCLDIAMRLKEYCSSLKNPKCSESNNHIMISIEVYAANIRVYRRNIANIVQSMQGTFDLV